MLDPTEDANEDSAASIVEETRFEDGQPAKIRLRSLFLSTQRPDRQNEAKLEVSQIAKWCIPIDAKFYADFKNV